jgi:hypothetical protein
MAKKRSKASDTIVLQMQGDGTDLFIVIDGVRIAKRGHPGTAYANTWVSLEPGWVVRDSRDYSHAQIEVEYQGVRVH